MSYHNGSKSAYTPELADIFCGYVGKNAMSMRNICKKYKDILPDDTTISDWLAKYPEFRSKYLDAKEIQALLITDQLWEEIESGLCKEQLDIFDRKFRFHQWHLSKMAPRHFGEKKEVKSEVTVTMYEDKLKELR